MSVKVEVDFSKTEAIVGFNKLQERLLTIFPNMPKEEPTNIFNHYKEVLASEIIDNKDLYDEESFEQHTEEPVFGLMLKENTFILFTHLPSGNVSLVEIKDCVKIG